MKNKINPYEHIGETHGIFTIVNVLDEKDKYYHYVYECVCNKCGIIKKYPYGSFTKKRQINNCNHLRIDNTTYKKNHKWLNQKLKKSYIHMARRCYNKNDKDYKYYGEKGIKICKSWLEDPNNFEQWALNNGYQDNLTIDRIDSTKNYCPENCRWVTMEENARRAGKVNWITVNDETLTGRQWSEKLGLGVNTINNILKEYGLNTTIKLIQAMLKEHPSTKHRRSHQTWLNVYGLNI